MNRRAQARYRRWIQEEVLNAVRLLDARGLLVTKGDFSLGSPLWNLKRDIQRSLDAVETVYRNHADRRSDPKRADRYSKETT